MSLCSWGDAKPRLRTALSDYLQEAEQAVNRGEECCYRISNTYMLLRGEVLDSGERELVVVALSGEMALGTLAAVQHAKLNHFTSIRAHFAKKGAQRFIARKLHLPVELIETRSNSEFVLRIRLADMGGKSSSSSSNTTTTTTTNVSGTSAVSGDNWGANISGVNNSDINLTMTDHGAMQVAAEFGEGALQLSQDALKNNTEVSTHAIDAITNMAGQQSATTKAALDMANAAKAREQTGTNESDNEVLKNISLMVGIVATLVTMYFMMKKGK